LKGTFVVTGNCLCSSCAALF